MPSRTAGDPVDGVGPARYGLGMPTITIEPATSGRFDDVQHAFENGGDGRGCQCQWWTISNADFRRRTTAERRELLASEIAAGPSPGLVAYVDGDAAGWVRVGPRTRQVRIGRTRMIADASEEPLDDPSVWAVSCFVVRREHRRVGLANQLLGAAIAHATTHGARVIEGYPVDVDAKKTSANELFHGALSSFIDAGFHEVARAAPARPIVSLTVR